MFKHILVAVDGSHTSEQALQEAIKLGKALRSQLQVVHVVDEVSLNWPEGGEFETVMESFRKSGREILDQAEGELQSAGVNGEVKLLEMTTMGQRTDEIIVNEAETWPADLIVIGSHGRRGVSRLLIGSVAEGVARIASIPVLIIPGAREAG